MNLNTCWCRVWKARLCGPLIVLIGSVWLFHHLSTSGLYSVSVAHQYGPLSWPGFSLLMMILVAALLCICRSWRCVRQQDIPDNVGQVQSATQDNDGFDDRRLCIGGTLVLLYGLGFVYLGFLIGSVLFLIVWMLYAGMRNPFKLVALSVLGTVAPLYVLIKVAYMPLPRGIGVLESVTIQLYEWLALF